MGTGIIPQTKVFVCQKCGRLFTQTIGCTDFIVTCPHCGTLNTRASTDVIGGEVVRRILKVFTGRLL
jgi:phage FluMu protein Com